MTAKRGMKRRWKRKEREREREGEREEVVPGGGVLEIVTAIPAIREAIADAYIDIEIMLRGMLDTHTPREAYKDKNA